MTLQKKSAVDHLYHPLSRPPSQCQTKVKSTVDFINKGNTCYANSILQILIMSTSWNRVPSESNTFSPMLWAISLNRTVKKNSTKPVEPSNFLWALKQKLCNIRGVHFDFNAQQDLTEILQVVLEELKCVSLATSQLIL